MVQIQTICKLISVKRGSHKLPRFIYHMTSSENYEKMLSSGSIKMTEDLMCGKGIFASELYNLFKRGCKPIEGTTLIERLLQQINTHGNKIILLRIPIQSINKDKLFIRSHKTVFDFCFSPKVSNAEKALSEECKKSGNWDNYLSKLKEIISNALNELDNKDIIEHLRANTPAKMAKLYKRRKHALEYVYKDNIPMSVVEKIGECSITNIEQASKYSIRNIFLSLLKETPEAKGTILLN